MGLAASQARYLSLSARKTNCEYEGQQINQQRLNLSNQSAALFNQMLTMSVPMPPSSTDFTKLQYSWNDGDLTFVMDSYYQIGKPDEQYNYVTTSYHYENIYTGQRKLLNDPQVQATKTNHFTVNLDKTFTIEDITYNSKKDTFTLNLTNVAGKTFTTTYKLCNQDENVDTVERLDAMYDRTSFVNSTNIDDITVNYPGGLTPSDPGYYSGTTITYDSGTYSYMDTNADTTVAVENKLELMRTYGAKYDPKKHYYRTGTGDNAKYLCLENIEDVKSSQFGKVEVRKHDGNLYFTDGTNYVSETTLKNLKVGDTMTTKSAINNPTFSDYKSIGNCSVEMLTEEMYKDDSTIITELAQIIKDMGGDKGDKTSYERLKACFDINGDYIGGTIYMFTLAGKKYFTTTADLDESLLSAYNINSVANNSIDSQQSKLSYYDAIYLNTKVTETKKALLETDGKGRFSTVKFEDDSVVYTLNVETIKDDDAYNDAMNHYYYEKEQYDKNIADINAKTEVIQAQDRQLQLKLEQLNTEQSALQTEMEACQKVVSKNIDNSFKTFGN